MYAGKNLSAPRAILAATALTLAFSFAGCKSTPTTPTDDAGLSAALQSRIAADGALSNEAIQSSVQKQVATLNGTVSNEAARSLAAADASQVPGIKTVVNNLTVQAAAPPVTAAAVAPPPLPPPPTPVAPKPKQPPTPKVKSAPIVHQSAPVEPPPPPQQAAEVAPPPPPVQQAPPPPPAFRNVTINPGTTIPIRITQTLDSATTQQGETFTGTIASDIVSDGIVVIRTGTPVSGRVVAVQEAAHYKGSSLLTIELTSINRHGQPVTVNTEPYSVQGKGRGGNTAAKVGGGAAVGAILGGIIGGGKGAAIGAAAGGGAGAGANTITRGEQVQIKSETLIRFNLTNTLSLRVPTGGETENPAPNPTLQQHPVNPPQQ